MFTKLPDASPSPVRLPDPPLAPPVARYAITDEGRAALALEDARDAAGRVAVPRPSTLAERMFALSDRLDAELDAEQDAVRDAALEEACRAIERRAPSVSRSV